MIDQKAPAGDSAVWIDGLETPVAPLSSVTGCAIINLIKAEVARLLTEAGSPPKVLTAACHLGEDAVAPALRGNLRRLPPPRRRALSIEAATGITHKSRRKWSL